MWTVDERRESDIGIRRIVESPIDRATILATIPLVLVRKRRRGDGRDSGGRKGAMEDFPRRISRGGKFSYLSHSTPRNYSCIRSGRILFDHPVEKHALAGCVEGRCTNGYRSRGAVAIIPLGSLRSTIAATTTTSGNGLDPRRSNAGSKGWGGRCSVTMETRRAVRHPFPRCIQPWGCDPRSKMQREPR